MIVVEPKDIIGSLTSNIVEPETSAGLEETVWAEKSYKESLASSINQLCYNVALNKFVSISKSDNTSVLTCNADFTSFSVLFSAPVSAVGIACDYTQSEYMIYGADGYAYIVDEFGSILNAPYLVSTDANFRGCTYYNNGSDGFYIFLSGSSTPGDNRFLVYEDNGTFVGEFPLNSDNQFPQDITATPDGSLFTLDLASGKIFKYNPETFLLESSVIFTDSAYSVRGITDAPSAELRVVDNLTPQNAISYYNNLSRGDNYQIGDEVISISTHKKYLCASPTTDDPLIGVNSTPPTWVESGTSNKYAMFDGVIGTQSKSADEIVVTIDFNGMAVNAIAGFNIQCDSINITVNDPNDGEVYNYDVDMNDYSGIADFYEYFFSPIAKRENFALFDLPAYPNATLTATFTATGGTAAVGELAVGNQVALGEAIMGTSVGLKSYSRREEDEFGNIVIDKRANVDITDYSVAILATNVGYVKRQLKALTDVPCVWAGNGDDETFLNYGYYDNLSIAYTNKSVSFTTLSVQGLT